MRYYFAARYSQHPQMRDYRDELVAAIPGVVVTSRWIDCHGGEFTQSFTPDELATDPAGCWPLGEYDLADIDAADVLVAFSASGGGKGGRHAEWGYALALGKRLVLIGQREHVFHTCPRVEWYGSWREFLDQERPS